MVTGTEKNRLSLFLQELRRRRVIRVAIVYAITAWIVIEIASTVLPAVNLPDWAVTLVVMLLVLGFPVAMMLAWAFDIGLTGIHREPPAAKRGSERTLDENASSDRPDTSAPAAERAREPDATARRSIAVLPFINISGDRDNEYFSDGISEELLNLLVKIPQLRVASRTSSFAFKGKEIDLRSVAKQLGVSTILEGSVRRAGGRVRITAQLIDADSDSHLWSETYDRQFEDVFAIQDDIARSIVTALQVTLNPKERRALQSVATASADAFDYYLRGRRFFYMTTKRNYQHALQMYTGAIGIDPNYAQAYAGIADCHSFLYMYGDSKPENLKRADEASLKALQLDPDLAETHASRGIALSISKRYADAEREFETAILLNPRLFEAYYFYARDCAVQGKTEKAARLYTQAAEVNPTDYQAVALLAEIYGKLNRPQEERAANLRALEIIERTLETQPDDARALYLGAASLAALGERDRALEWAARAADTERDEPAVLYNISCVYTHLGEKERALDCLERAADLGFGYRAWVENDPTLEPLHGEPRFQAVLARLT
jgi:adenylate cyclase